MLLEVEPHPLKYKRKGGSRQLWLLPDLHLNSHLILTLILVELRFSSLSKEASPLEGSTHPWVKLSFLEERNVLLFKGG
jgi:hypothetical protein